jgi:hypothetical protein
VRERAQVNLCPHRAAIKSDASLHGGNISLNQKCARGKIARERAARFS